RRRDVAFFPMRIMNGEGEFSHLSRLDGEVPLLENVSDFDHTIAVPSNLRRRVTRSSTARAIRLNAISSVATAVIVGLTWSMSSLNIRLGMVTCVPETK